MSEEISSEHETNWRFLWEMKVAAQAVSEVYVSLGLLGGHYVKVAPKDFLDAVNDMQAVSDTHPHPRRFQFTMERDVLWVHTAMPSKLRKRANENVVTRQSADGDPRSC